MYTLLHRLVAFLCQMYMKTLNSQQLLNLLRLIKLITEIKFALLLLVRLCIVTVLLTIWQEVSNLEAKMRQSTCLRSYQDKFGSWSPWNERFFFTILRLAKIWILGFPLWGCTGTFSAWLGARCVSGSLHIHSCSWICCTVNIWHSTFPLLNTHPL